MSLFFVLVEFFAIVQMEDTLNAQSSARAQTSSGAQSSGEERSPPQKRLRRRSPTPSDAEIEEVTLLIGGFSFKVGIAWYCQIFQIDSIHTRHAWPYSI